jgi:hypothetical protein
LSTEDRIYIRGQTRNVQNRVIYVGIIEFVSNFVIGSIKAMNLREGSCKSDKLYVCTKSNASTRSTLHVLVRIPVNCTVTPNLSSCFFTLCKAYRTTALSCINSWFFIVIFGLLFP